MTSDAGALQLTAAERERRWPNVRPRDAATLIVIDRAGAKPRVLMGRRNTGHAFMPGKFVFPGGRVEPADRRMAFTTPLDSALEAKLNFGVVKPSVARARTFALAAVRETFEETGLLIGRRAAEAGRAAPAGVWSEFAGHGVLPSLAEMYFIARAITPPRRPRRFDAAFFAVDSELIVHRIEGTVGAQTELTEVVWLTLEEARQSDLPTITAVVLKELEARIAAGMGHDLPVPFYVERHRKWRRDLL